MEVDDNMHISKSRLLFVNILISASVFLSCSIPQQKTQTETFSPILVRRYNAEVDLGKEQISNNPQLAIEYFNRAIEKNLNRPEAFFGRGAARLALEQYALAIKDLDMALEADWSSQPIRDVFVGRSWCSLLRAKAGMGLLTSIDRKKDIETWVLTFGRIDIDLELAEAAAGTIEDIELIKKSLRRGIYLNLA